MSFFQSADIVGFILPRMVVAQHPEAESSESEIQNLKQGRTGPRRLSRRQTLSET
jgi:hypothetical protein